VEITVTHEARSGGRLLQRVMRNSVRQMVTRTVDGELEKLTQHVEQVPAG
jgi:hypothetical protein